MIINKFNCFFEMILPISFAFQYESPGPGPFEVKSSGLILFSLFR